MRPAHISGLLRVCEPFTRGPWALLLERPEFMWQCTIDATGAGSRWQESHFLLGRRHTQDLGGTRVALDNPSTGQKCASSRRQRDASRKCFALSHAQNTVQSLSARAKGYPADRFRSGPVTPHTNGALHETHAFGTCQRGSVRVFTCIPHRGACAEAWRHAGPDHPARAAEPRVLYLDVGPHRPGDREDLRRPSRVAHDELRRVREVRRRGRRRTGSHRCRVATAGACCPRLGPSSGSRQPAHRRQPNGRSGLANARWMA